MEAVAVLGISSTGSYLERQLQQGVTQHGQGSCDVRCRIKRVRVSWHVLPSVPSKDLIKHYYFSYIGLFCLLRERLCMFLLRAPDIPGLPLSRRYIEEGKSMKDKVFIMKIKIKRITN